MKKVYRKPEIKMINIPSADIICTSDPINTGNRFNSGYNDYIGFGGQYEGEID